MNEDSADFDESYIYSCWIKIMFQTAQLYIEVELLFVGYIIFFLLMLGSLAKNFESKIFLNTGWQNKFWWYVYI